MALPDGNVAELQHWMESVHEADRETILHRLRNYGPIVLPAAALERRGAAPGYSVAEYCAIQMLTKMDRFLAEVRCEKPDRGLIVEHLLDFRNYALMAERAVVFGAWPAFQPHPE